MDPLPSFGDLIESLSLSEQSDHEPSSSASRSRSMSRSSLSSLASSTLHTRRSSTSSEDRLNSPPPDISSADRSPQSMRLAKSRSVGRLRGSRYAPYKDCSRRPSLPCLLPNISLQPASPTVSENEILPDTTQNPYCRFISPNQITTGGGGNNPQTQTQAQGQTLPQTHPHAQQHSHPHSHPHPQRARHTRTRSSNASSDMSHPSSPISLYARRSHSRTNSLKNISITGGGSAPNGNQSSTTQSQGQGQTQNQISLPTGGLTGLGLSLGPSLGQTQTQAQTQSSPSPPPPLISLNFEPPKLPTVPSIQPFNPQYIPQRNVVREPLAPMSASNTNGGGYPRQMGLRISGFIGSERAPARYICA